MPHAKTHAQTNVQTLAPIATPPASTIADDLTLVFPAGLPDAQRYRAEAAAAGRRLIGASSLRFDPAAADYDDWALLPYVHAAGFADAVRALVRERGITAIYTPHQVVSGVLADILPRVAPRVRLVAPNPLLGAEAAYRRALDKAEAASARPSFALPGGAAPLTAIERAGLVRLVDTIPGMTDLDKIDAAIEVMRHAPSGDVVEIGSWWGRSAALFLLLARRHRIGPVLCVDPWRTDCLDQGVAVLDQASRRMDTEGALEIFQMNLSPLAQGDLNYIQAPSVEGAKRYGAVTIETKVFGPVTYSGEIALLHIDGNHAYENVLADARAWTPHVKPGGWIVFDDYVWAFGDGPKRVGDAFLADNALRIDLSFVTGTALFVRLCA